jgi:hypothetical protein
MVDKVRDNPVERFEVGSPTVQKNNRGTFSFRDIMDIQVMIFKIHLKSHPCLILFGGF